MSIDNSNYARIMAQAEQKKYTSQRQQSLPNRINAVATSIEYKRKENKQEEDEDDEEEEDEEEEEQSEEEYDEEEEESELKYEDEEEVKEEEVKRQPNKGLRHSKSLGKDAYKQFIQGGTLTDHTKKDQI